MKKTIPAILLLLFLLVGCNIKLELPTISRTTSTEDLTTTTSNEITTSTTESSTSTTSTIEATTTATTSTPIEEEPRESLYKNLFYYRYGQNAYMPSSGEVNALVIPVNFRNDGTTYTRNYSYDLIEKAFFGSSSDTGWESLKSYYYKSSYGNLNIDGTVTPWYETDHVYTYYTEDKVDEIIEDALSYFDDQYDYTDYDSDNDGVIDALYFVYARPVDWSGDNITFWAWQSMYSGSAKWDTLDVYQFVWIGAEFFTSDRYGNEISTINSTTVIHETCHMMGGDDYYDYYKGEYEGWDFKSIGADIGVGGADMMDNNIGDHSIATKILLGWVDPQIIETTTYNITLNSSTETGDSVIIAPNWDEESNYLSEYFIVEFYTPTGLNAPTLYSSTGGGFTIPGIKIMHINAKAIEENTGSYVDGDYFNNSKNLFTYDNSDSEIAFLALIDKHNHEVLHNDFVRSDLDAEDDALFLEDDIFAPTKTLNQYSDKTILNFILTVNSIDDNSANISIRFY